MLCLIPLQASLVYADASEEKLYNAKEKLSQLLVPASDQAFRKVDVSALSRFKLDTTHVQEQTIDPKRYSGKNNTGIPVANHSTNFRQAIWQALQRRPEITQSIASAAGQSANIDVVKSQYYPQISGGITTADLTSGERGRQLLTLSATQVLYDFGKIKSSVNIEEARLAEQQAGVLVNIDNIAFQVANAIVNIRRYEDITQIADQQIKGIARITEIARLRAKAGISSQSDPIQAQSDLEAAESNKIIQETQLRQYQQRLRTLLGYEVSDINWEIPADVIQYSGLYTEPKFNQIPEIMVAQAAVQVAKLQKQQKRLSVYPTINVKGSLSQAFNGRNPNNNQDDGFYNSIMLEASSNLYQGGAITSQARVASYAEEAAKAQVNATYLDILDQIRALRTEIENKQRQINVLVARQQTTTRTRELYQEQYKLGTRTVVDLLNAEQSIHRAAQDIEAARYDIYSALLKYVQITGRSRDLYQLNNLAIQGFEIQP